MSLEGSKRLVQAMSHRMVEGVEKPSPHQHVEATIFRSGEMISALLESAKSKPIYISMKWPTSDALHAVVLKGKDEHGNVLFSNPHGETTIPDLSGSGRLIPAREGTHLSDPPRTIVQNITGLQMMTPENFERYFNSALVNEKAFDKEGDSPLFARIKIFQGMESALGGKLRAGADEQCKRMIPEFLRSEGFQDDLKTAISVGLAGPGDKKDDSHLNLLRECLGPHEPVDKVIEKMTEGIRSGNTIERENIIKQITSRIMRSERVLNLVSSFTEINADNIASIVKKGKELKDDVAGIEVSQGAIVHDFVRERIKIVVEDLLHSNLKGVISKTLREVAPEQKLLNLDFSAKDWSKNLDVDKVLEFASKARNVLAVGQKDNRDIPHSLRPSRYLSVSRLISWASSGVQLASAACAGASIACTVAAKVGMFASLAAVSAPLGTVGFGLLMGHIAGGMLWTLGREMLGRKSLPDDFDWSHVQAAKEKVYLTDAEILSALALTFHKVRGKNPDSSLDLPRNKYLKDLADAMNELAGPNSKGAKEGMNIARQRTELLRKIKASTENFERSRPKKKSLGFWMAGANIARLATLGL